MKIESRLRIILAVKDIRQKQLAAKLKISQNTLSSLVNNHSLPSLEMAYKIADELEMSVEQIWIKEKGEE